MDTPESIPDTQPQVKPSRQISRSTLVLMGVILLTSIAVGVRSYGQLMTKRQTPKTQVVNKPVVVRRSKEPNVIVNATTAKKIDAVTGKVITAARVFFVDDKTIFLALDLNNPSIGTRIDYVRYLNGRYVDHGSVQVTKPQTNNLNFEWTTKLVGSRLNGTYRVATYTNGVLEKRVTYAVEKHKVAFVYPDEDYSLPDSSFLTQAH